MPTPPPVDQVVIPALLRAARGAYGNAIRAELAEGGFDDMPRNGSYVLGGMANHGGTAADLIRQLGVTKQAASQLIDTLVLRGYLARETNPDDRRRVTIELTERGAAAAAAVRAGVVSVDDELEAMLSPARLSGLRAGLIALCDIRDRQEDAHRAACGPLGQARLPQSPRSRCTPAGYPEAHGDALPAASVANVQNSPSLAVVTGASRGIGRVLVERLTASGHTVIAVGRSAEDLARVAEATGAVPVVLDVSDASAVGDAWAAVESTYGVPTLLVNNAGVAGTSGVTWAQEPADWWRVFEVNVLGTFLMTRAALPGMVARGSGRIVNVSSNAAFYPIGDEDSDGVINAAYMASKAAVIRFTEAVSGETAPFGVQVFATSPGTVKTDMTSVIFADEWDDPELWSPPELTAELVEFIATGALDGLSGRYIHAARDDWRHLAGHTADVLADDTHALRVRSQ